MLSIKAEGMAGMTTGQFAEECIRLANKVGVCVESKFNNIECRFYPGDDEISMSNAIKVAQDNKRKLVLGGGGGAIIPGNPLITFGRTVGIRV